MEVFNLDLDEMISRVFDGCLERVKVASEYESKSWKYEDSPALNSWSLELFRNSSLLTLRGSFPESRTCYTAQIAQI